MSVPAHASPDLCHLLHEDPDLAEAMAPAVRGRAAQECVAPTIWLFPGRLVPQSAGMPQDGVGLLVLEGLLIRRVGVDGRFGAELLGAGDLVRPWHGEDESPTLSLTTGWRVLEPTRMAVLDERVTHRLAPYPQLIAGLVGRAVQRSRNLAVNMAIVHQARVEVRLHMLMWHLAGRWGRVRGDGVVVPLRLTHSVLADLVAARRPTVTSALSELARRGAVLGSSGKWLLCGDPPGELLELTPVKVSPSNG